MRARPLIGRPFVPGSKGGWGWGGGVQAAWLGSVILAEATSHRPWGSSGAPRAAHTAAQDKQAPFALEEKDGEFPCFKDKTGKRVLCNGQDAGQARATIASPGSQ